MRLRAEINGVWQDVSFDDIVRLRKQEDRQIRAAFQEYLDASAALDEQPASDERHGDQPKEGADE